MLEYSILHAEKLLLWEPLVTGTTGGYSPLYLQGVKGNVSSNQSGPQVFARTGYS